ncbi:protein hu-li tai shao isoform X5 [Nasonia vitripennis]|uniref:Class II aldolase/adducin N-terminal domain-containing protein n=1 Tax=Nasonia vitripennis TaxID=7425 RepID=A0A7M7QRL9_NASVI|nr:protein hu-li tai shao isoform X5 [Nasonia vitripennis]
MAMLHLTLIANVINKALITTISSRVDLTVLEDGNNDDKMADTSQQQQEAPEPPQTNGAVDGLTEEEKSKIRPADIDADMREMERRKRVEMMMNSRLFREELERIIETQMKDGAGPSGLLQQISEMMGPQGARFNANAFRNSNCVVPINDIRGVESMGYAKGEKLLRCKLAAVFRLLDLYGWTQGVGGMITARLNQDQEHFLVNPYGLLYHETTASSLVKADMQGGIVEQGTTNFGVHIASYQLHSTIHAARPDIKCIVHIATPSVTAISATKSGILPLGQESIVIGEVSTHHYISGANLDPEEREKLARNFGPINKVMLLTNRGALCCGETVEEAFYNVYNTVLACETQLKLMPLGVDNLSLISDETRKAIYEASRKAPVPQQSSVAEPSPLAEKLEKRWRIGGTEFEALMRMLDNAGFRTGYIYRHPLVKSEPPRPRNDVEVPPAVSSLGYLLEEEELYKQGLWKGGRKGTDRTRWLNSPNVYQKVEILETGTPDPKKITKWVSDGSPTHSSTPVKIDGALQFVPKNTNPKEFKQLQQQIKDYRRADKISAGPQSHILEGVTWEEAKKMQDATISGTGEQVVLVGAASKGIIQRGFQHNAMVYKTPYAKNPFDAVTDQELDQYKKEIERKTKGDPYDESQSESEALSSFNISRATHESSTAKSPIQSPVSVTSETEEESRDEPKVLRIETKQVPAPSQPEVVLSDERSVKISVAGNSVARREDVKSEHSKAQRATNVKTVNADFLNEQRRSEMLTRRNANGRGENTVNGDHSDAHHSTFSHSSKEDVSVSEESPKKEKKKKKGLRTPSFLKKKKEKKKPVEA